MILRRSLKYASVLPSNNGAGGYLASKVYE